MHGTLIDRILWAVAYVGLGVFCSVVALDQFGTAWTMALGDAHPGERSDHVADY
jgi:hypothetical protein